jgi:cyclase
MRPLRCALLPLLMGALSISARAQLPPPPPGAAYEGKAYTFSKIVDGVFHAVGTGAMAVGANATVIINDNEVMLVDSHVSPAAAWALLKELRELTPKPVRYVVNTHFHYDHAHGNQVYGPGVEIIGHEFTRAALLAGTSKTSASYLGLVRVLGQRDDSLRRMVARARGDSARAAARRGLQQVQRYQQAVDAVTPVPPTITLSQQLTLIRGGREIRIVFLGRGHTGGDVVVHLPKERVLITGDLVGSGLPYLGDGYIDEWATTLEQLPSLAWDVMLPGHGAPVLDRDRPLQLAGLLRDFHRQATALLDQGLSVDSAEPRIDVSAHVRHYPALAARTSDDLRERFTLGLYRIRELGQAK